MSTGTASVRATMVRRFVGMTFSAFSFRRKPDEARRRGHEANRYFGVASLGFDLEDVTLRSWRSTTRATSARPSKFTHGQLNPRPGARVGSRRLHFSPPRLPR